MRRTCKNCGKLLLDDAKFCTLCGKPVNETPLQETKVVEKKYCKNCGNEISASEELCNMCKNIEEQKSKPTSQPKSEPQTPAAIPPTPEPEPPMIKDAETKIEQKPVEKPKSELPAKAAKSTKNVSKEPSKNIASVKNFIHKRSMKEKKIAAVAVAAIVVIAGLWFLFQPGRPEYTEYQQAIAEFNVAYDDHVDASISMQEATYDLVGLLSDDFTKDASNPSNVDTDDAIAFIDTLHEKTPVFSKAFLSGYNYLEEWVDVQDLSISEHHSLVLIATFVAGVGLLAYGAYKSVKNGVNKNIDLAGNSINDATPGQLTEINEILNIDASSTKQQAKNEYERIVNQESLATANNAARNILSVEMYSPSSSHAHSHEVKQTQAEIFTDVGKASVTLYAGSITTLTSGQGVIQLAGAFGASAETAAIVDLGVSAAGKQPLDLLGEQCQVAVASNEQKEVIVDKPEIEMDTDEAVTVLQKVSDNKLDEVSLSEFSNSLDTVASNMADIYQIDLETVEYDTYKVIKVPKYIHVQVVNNLKNAGMIQIPDFGMSGLMISNLLQVPDVIEDIDTSEHPNVGLDWVDVGDAEPYNPETYSLTVVASPSNPSPNQDVTVTARLTPAVAGVEIYFHISGTDGYTDTDTYETDSSGKATFHIPGGGESVTDTVTVRVIETGHQKVFSYVF